VDRGDRLGVVGYGMPNGGGHASYLAGFNATNATKEADVTVRLSNVKGLAEPPGYAHVAVGTGARLVFTAGAVPLDANGALVGEDDPLLQAGQVIENLLVALAEGGAAPGDLLKTTVYVVGPHEALIRVWDVVRASPIGQAPSTLLGVALLGYTGQLVEIEAVAIVEGGAASDE